MIPRPLAVGIMLLVSVVWAADFVANIVIVGYESSELIHVAFMSIVGGALAFARKDKPSDDTSVPDRNDSPS